MSASDSILIMSLLLVIVGGIGTGITPEIKAQVRYRWMAVVGAIGVCIKLAIGFNLGGPRESKVLALVTWLIIAVALLSGLFDKLHFLREQKARVRRNDSV